MWQPTVKHFYLLFLILGMAVACKVPQTQSGGIHFLDLAAIKDNPVKFGLKEFAAAIEYIPLETRPDVLLGSAKYWVGKDIIYVLTNEHRVLLFNRQGKFIRTIGARGKGPGEFDSANDIQVSSDGTRIYLYSTATCTSYCYSPGGSLLSRFKTAYLTWSMASISAGKFIMISPYGDFSGSGTGKFLYSIQDSSGGVIRKYPSDHIIKAGGDLTIGRFFINPLSVLTYIPFTDTVFRVDPNGEMIPTFALNFGKYRTPDEAFNDFSVLQQNRYRFFTDLFLVETERGVFIRYSYQNGFRTGYYAYNHTPVQAIQNSNGLIINDFDAGPDFFPASSDGKKEVYALLQPVDLLLHMKEGEFESKQFSNRSAHKSFEKFMGTLRENSNPVLMVVTLK